MAIYLQITVVPRSGRREIKQSGAVLKCYLKQAPEHGKANQELVKFLAQLLRITQDQITITAGATRRKKRVKIDVDWSLEEVLKNLDLCN